MSWIDTHCHLEDSIELAAILAQATLANVKSMITVGTDIGSSLQTVSLASAIATAKESGMDLRQFVKKRFQDASAADILLSKSPYDENDILDLPDIWAVVGVHPHEAKNGVAPLYDIVGGLDESGKGHTGSVVAIGECGLDYYYGNSPVEDQKRAFTEQILLAHRLDLSLVIHTRDAWQDTFEILSEHKLPTNTIIHCFTGTVSEARRLIDMGAYISFSGIVTFKNALDIQDAAKFCPMDRILVETDSPYLTPVPHRGIKNQPGFVGLVGAKIAEIKGIGVDQVAEQTLNNARQAFSLL